MSYLHLLQFVGWQSARHRLVETLSHTEKEVIFLNYISASTLSVCHPRLSSPWLLSLHSPHQHNGRISIFRKQTPLEDSHQALARRYEHPRSHEKKHTPTWYQTHYFSYSQPQTRRTHTRFPRQTHQLYYIVSVRARGRGKLEGTAAACTIQLNLRIRQVFELAATGATQKTQLQLLSHFFSPPRHLRVRKRKIQLCRVADLNILFNWLKLEKQ